MPSLLRFENTNQIRRDRNISNRHRATGSPNTTLDVKWLAPTWLRDVKFLPWRTPSASKQRVDFDNTMFFAVSKAEHFKATCQTDLAIRVRYEKNDACNTTMAMTMTMTMTMTVTVTVTMTVTVTTRQ